MRINGTEGRLVIGDEFYILASLYALVNGHTVNNFNFSCLRVQQLVRLLKAAANSYFSANPRAP